MTTPIPLLRGFLEEGHFPFINDYDFKRLQTNSAEILVEGGHSRGRWYL